MAYLILSDQTNEEQMTRTFIVLLDETKTVVDPETGETVADGQWLQNYTFSTQPVEGGPTDPADIEASIMNELDGLANSDAASRRAALEQQAQQAEAERYVIQPAE